MTRSFKTGFCTLAACMLAVAYVGEARAQVVYSTANLRYRIVAVRSAQSPQWDLLSNGRTIRDHGGAYIDALVEFPNGINRGALSNYSVTFVAQGGTTGNDMPPIAVYRILNPRTGVSSGIQAVFRFSATPAKAGRIYATANYQFSDASGASYTTNQSATAQVR